jgi:hypothetical protein
MTYEWQYVQHDWFFCHILYVETLFVCKAADKILMMRILLASAGDIHLCCHHSAIPLTIRKQPPYNQTALVQNTLHVSANKIINRPRCYKNTQNA